jgi:hypothetical protein
MSQIVLLNSGPTVGGMSLYRTIGAYKIAHQCRKNGYTAQVIDHINYLSQDELSKLLEKFVDADTLVLGLSTTFTLDWPYRKMPDILINCLNEIKNRFPGLKLIYGGYGLACVDNPTTPLAWGVIKEYGEDTFMDLVTFFAGKGPEPRYKLIFNREGDPVRSYQSDRDRFDIVNDDFKWHKDDAILPGEALPIEISRGCIFKCKFCNHLLLGRGKLDYLREMELVREEMIYNYENWGTTRYYIICDTFNDTEVKMQAWHRMVTSLPFKIEYTGYLRADLLHRFPDVPHMLKESGLISCFHGIESLGPGAQAVGKGWSYNSGREYLPELYNNIWKKEVFQTLAFIVGLPGDSKDEARSWIKWFGENDMYNMSPHILGLHNPRAGSGTHLSEFDRNAEKYGYTFPFRSNDQWHHPDWGHKREALTFLNEELLPALGPLNARHGSWQIVQLLQLGIPKWRFEKQHRHSFTKADIEQRIKVRRDDYYNRLLRM